MGRPEVDEVTRNAIHSVNFVAFVRRRFGVPVKPSESTQSKSGRHTARRCKQTNSNIASRAEIAWPAVAANSGATPWDGVMNPEHYRVRIEV
jgi:hypothetical protein